MTREQRVRDLTLALIRANLDWPESQQMGEDWLEGHFGGRWRPVAEAIQDSIEEVVRERRGRL